MSDEANNMPGVLGRGMRVAGWLCVAGIACVIIEMVTILPYMPEAWWTPPELLGLREGQVDLRGVGVMHPGLLGWLGGWGYLLAFAWFPAAVWRSTQARRRGMVLRSDERVLLVLSAPVTGTAALAADLSVVRTVEGRADQGCDTKP